MIIEKTLEVTILTNFNVKTEYHIRDRFFNHNLFQ